MALAVTLFLEFNLARYLREVAGTTSERRAAIAASTALDSVSLGGGAAV
jgi:hypothetical protein